MKQINKMCLSWNIELSTVDKLTRKILDTRKIHNIVVDDGLERVSKLLNGSSTNAFTIIGIGTGTTAEVAGDTALETEVTRQTASNITNDTVTTANYSNTFTFGSGESYAITEAGLLDSLIVTGSILFNRATFTALNVSDTIDLIANITITVSRL